DHDGGKTKDGQPNPEDETHEAAGPGLPERGGEVIALGGVVHDVRSPEETALVADAVKPVVAELIPEKKQEPSPPLVANGEDGETVEVSENGKLNELGEEIHQDVTDAQGDAGGGVLEFIEVAMKNRGRHGFQNHK